MQRNSALVALDVLWLTGCATLPQLPSEYGVPVDAVTRHIKCELQRAASEVPGFSGKGEGALIWIAALNLNMRVVENRGGGLDAALSVPLLAPGIFTIGLVGSLNIDSIRDASFKFQEDMSNLQTYECGDDEEDGPYLAGKIGLKEWLTQVDSVRAQNIATPYEVGYILQFIIRPTGSLSPRFSLIPIGNTSFGAGGAVNASDTITHSLTIALVIKPPEPDPLRVIIVGDETRPGARIRKPARSGGRVIYVNPDVAVDTQDIRSRLNRIEDDLLDRRQ